MEMVVSREAAINEYLKSYQFEKDLDKMVEPRMGFTTMVNRAVDLFLKENLYPNYNLDAKDLTNKVLVGI